MEMIRFKKFFKIVIRGYKFFKDKFDEFMK